MTSTPGATDCHAHVFDPVRFPYAAGRRYTPPPATVDELLRLHDALGLQRVVLVQPSVYGSDNRCMVSALRQLGDRARGVAVIDDSFDRTHLEDLWAVGVRGVRLNLQVAREQDASQGQRMLEALAHAVSEVPLLVQIHAATAIVLSCAATIRAMRQPLLIDHFGLVRAAGGASQPELAPLLDLLAVPHVWIKLSGPYQISEASPGYEDIAPIARALFDAAPERTLWGSDWPHTGGVARSANYRMTDVEAFRSEDDASNLGLIDTWLPQAADRERLLKSNPARLFGFDA